MSFKDELSIQCMCYRYRYDSDYLEFVWKTLNFYQFMATKDFNCFNDIIVSLFLIVYMRVLMTIVD